jgi:succinate dehydrogenase / fumarate reductase iron-sulfur subunit
VRAQIIVKRFNPEAEGAGAKFLSEYSVDYSRGTTLLSALLKIKAENDGTLTFRSSCRAAICGSCLMQVNGTQKLACKVSLHDEVIRYGRIDVGPMANLPIIKDMVVDMAPFWKKIKAVTPYVVSAEQTPLPPSALKDINEQMYNADGCIMCSACLSACTTYQVSDQFLGPAALAKAYRLLVDPRDKIHQERLTLLGQDNGIWDCVRCNFCVSVCPKEVAPMEQIVRLRRLSIAAGLDQTVGARHITQFCKVVGQEGRLNETLLPILMTWGHWKKMLRIIPLGIKMFLRGKTPFPFKRPEGYQKVQRIFKKRMG